MSAFPKYRGISFVCAAVVSCVLLSLSSHALAAAVTYNYMGNVTNATGIFAGQGSVVTGTFTFDDRMLDWSADPYQDDFKYVNPSGDYMKMSATVKVGSAVVVIEPTEHANSQVGVYDGFHRFGCTDMEGCDDVHDSIGFRIYDYSTSLLLLQAFDSSDQAVAPGAGSLSSTVAGLIDIFDHLDLSLFRDFAEGYALLGSAEYPHDELRFTWTGISRVQDENPTTIPEPATLSLFGLGLAGLAALRRCNRAS